jgi:cytidine deaminase
MATQNLISDSTRAALVEAAQEVRENAYAPYSKYKVGAALLGRNGEIYRGCNVENAAYPSTICAERSAAVQAVSHGVREFDAIAVVTSNGGAPCGACRQVLFEFGPDMHVIIADAEGHIQAELSLRELLPRGFGPKSLPDVP